MFKTAVFQLTFAQQAANQSPVFSLDNLGAGAQPVVSKTSVRVYTPPDIDSRTGRIGGELAKTRLVELISTLLKLRWQHTFVCLHPLID